MIALVRQLHIPCRYVSGYLYHEDKCQDRSPAGAPMHGWKHILARPAGWSLIRQTICRAAIATFASRSAATMLMFPTRGVHRGEAESELRVSVTVSSVDAPKLEEMAPPIIMRSKWPSLLPSWRMTPHKANNSNSSSQLLGLIP